MAIVTKSRTYSTSQQLTAPNYNEDRDEIIAGVNSINNAQIAADAAIAASKLDPTLVTSSSTNTLTNKTLTSPVINVTSDSTGDLYYRNSGGQFTRLPIGTNGYSLVVRGGLPSWEVRPSFLVTRNAVQSINDSTATKIEFNSESFDTNTNFDTTTHRFTPTVPGKYLLNLNVRYAASAGDGKSVAASIYKNGSESAGTIEYEAGATSITTANVSIIIDANGSSDFFEFYTRQTSGGALNLDSNPLYVFATGCKID